MGAGDYLVCVFFRLFFFVILSFSESTGSAWDQQAQEHPSSRLGLGHMYVFLVPVQERSKFSINLDSKNRIV